MLAPICRGRRNKRTSFKTLKIYLLEGIDPITREKFVRGECVLSPNLENAEIAHLQMRAVAFGNARVKDPIYHFEITWPRDEKPTKEQWLSAAHKTINALGFSEHQYLIVEHDDRDHFHVHIMINRVHPRTFRAHYPYKDMQTLDRCMREIEHEQNWKQCVGHYRWDKEKNRAELNTPSERRQLSAAAKQLSEQTQNDELDGHESLIKYASGKPAKALAMLLNQGSVGWKDVHQLLRGFGLELEKSERGGYMVREIETGLRVKSSEVFRHNFAGKENRRAMEEKLGDWQMPSGESLRANFEVPARRPRTSREQQAEQRAKERALLKQEFLAYRSAQREKQKKCTAEFRQKRTEIYDELKLRQAAIRQKIRDRKQRKRELSRIQLEAVKNLQILRAQSARERARLEPMTYQPWIFTRHEAGDKRATAQIRGWKYQDRRQFRKQSANSNEQSEPIEFLTGVGDVESDWIGATREQLKRLMEANDSEQLAKTISSVRTSLDPRNGDIYYTIRGKVSVVDKGSRLAVLDQDEAVIVFALEMAVQKYGPVLRAEGSAEWARKVARVAGKHGMNVTFADPEMQAIMTREQYRSGRFGAVAMGLASVEEDTGKGNTHIDDRQVANALLNSVFGNGRGTTYLDNLTNRMGRGEVRTANIRDVFVIKVKMDARSRLSFEIAVHPGKHEEFAALVTSAKARAAAEWQRPKTGRQRSEILEPRSIKRPELGR